MNTRLKIVLPLLALGAALAASPAYAHGFGERYDLPVPLGYFMAGAGAAVALSFTIIGIFARGGPSRGAYRRHDLLSHPLARAVLTGALLVWPLRLLSVFPLGLVIATGLVGSQTSSLNFAPTFVWIIWWVGMGFAVALIGNFWALVNPWKVLFGWAEALYARIRPGASRSFNEEYPSGWGIWPALVLFLAFSWIENAYSESAVPERVGVMAIAYTIITLGGMLYFGKHQWLRHGEAFTVVFGFLARFSPTEVRVTDPEICDACGSGCRDLDGGCVDCYECFERAGASLPTGARTAGAAACLTPNSSPGAGRQLNLRPFAAGLVRNERVTTDTLAVVILLLSTVTFDGFGATPAWVDVQGYSLDVFSGTLNNVVLNGITIANTLGLVLFPVVFLLVYLTFSYFMSKAVGGTAGVADLAKAFVYSLIPIALAYNIAHFLTLLLVQGQLIVPLASDPFGKGWDLFGTADYTIDIGVINAKILWFLSVGVIVLGHVIAVYLAHRVATRLFETSAMALRSQVPMLALMVLYTVVSLWIIAQPIAD